MGVNVQSPTQISITLTPTAVSCFGVPDGIISAAVTGGAGGIGFYIINYISFTF